jgi:hypothetical protein
VTCPISAAQVVETEVAAFFRTRLRPTCDHVEHRRDLRQTDGKIVCESCGSPLVPVKR